MGGAFSTTDRLTVGLGERSYPILFGSGILAGLGDTCRSLNLGKTAAVVTNQTVGGLYFEAARESLAKAGFSPLRIDIGDGEEFKNLETVRVIYDRLIDAGIDRGDFIVALGGGIVGDVAGFAAATYLRGIPFVQVPTTLLAQVDSSVGGKTGVNHDRGKNLIGAFYQPAAVVMDTATLATLPEREFLCGLAEVVKYGVVLDAPLFADLEANVPALLAREPDFLRLVAERCCRLKAGIVEKDEREGGLRAVLNFGHSIGHAVETLTNYAEYKHGEAVSIGMVQAARYSEALGLSDKAATERIEKLLKELRLPVEAPSFSVPAYVDAVLHDKKVRDGGITFVLNRGIGAFEFSRITDVPELLRVCGIGG